MLHFLSWLLTCLLAFAKLAALGAMATASWWLVFAPVLIFYGCAVAFIVGAFLMMIIVGLLVAVFETRSTRKF